MSRSLKFRAQLEVIVNDCRNPIPSRYAVHAVSELVEFLENEMLSGGLHSKFVAHTLRRLVGLYEGGWSVSRSVSDEVRARHDLKIQQAMDRIERRWVPQSPNTVDANELQRHVDNLQDIVEIALRGV
jgi:hypothetical protein